MTKLDRVTKNVFQVGAAIGALVICAIFSLAMFMTGCGDSKTTINGDGNTIINADSGAAGSTTVSVAPSMPPDHAIYTNDTNCSQGGCHESYDRHQGVEGADIQECDTCHEPAP